MTGVRLTARIYLCSARRELIVVNIDFRLTTCVSQRVISSVLQTPAISLEYSVGLCGQRERRLHQP